MIKSSMNVAMLTQPAQEKIPTSITLLESSGTISPQLLSNRDIEIQDLSKLELTIDGECFRVTQDIVNVPYRDGNEKTFDARVLIDSQGRRIIHPKVSEKAKVQINYSLAPSNDEVKILSAEIFFYFGKELPNKKDIVKTANYRTPQVRKVNKVHVASTPLGEIFKYEVEVGCLIIPCILGAEPRLEIEVVNPLEISKIVIKEDMKNIHEGKGERACALAGGRPIGLFVNLIGNGPVCDFDVEQSIDARRLIEYKLRGYYSKNTHSAGPAEA